MFFVNNPRSSRPTRVHYFSLRLFDSLAPEYRGIMYLVARWLKRISIPSSQPCPGEYLLGQTILCSHTTWGVQGITPPPPLGLSKPRARDPAAADSYHLNISEPFYSRRPRPQTTQLSSNRMGFVFLVSISALGHGQRRPLAFPPDPRPCNRWFFSRFFSTIHHY